MNKIGVLLEAGLGNQLFMIFALVSYSIDNLTDYCIYCKIGEPKKTYWNTLLDAFKDKVILDKPDNNIMVYKEPHFHYKRVPKFNECVILKGYFQSHKYFEHNLMQILQLMSFEKKMDIIKYEFLELLKRKCIALHFRIGDYIGLQAYHPIQLPNYYIRSIKAMMDELAAEGDDISNYNILYFCQASDNNIVAEYMQIFANAFGKDAQKLNFVKVPDNIDDWKQMLLMTSCEHFIIANSTFSWFPAYIACRLRKNKKTHVFYPTHWFGQMYCNNKIDDLFIESWKGFNDR